METDVEVGAGEALDRRSARRREAFEEHRAAVELQVETGTDRASVRGRVLRSAVVRVRPTWVCYRGAIAFDRHLPWFVDERGEASTPQVL
jgi:hypothetical protein